MCCVPPAATTASAPLSLLGKGEEEEVIKFMYPPLLSQNDGWLYAQAGTQHSSLCREQCSASHTQHGAFANSFAQNAWECGLWVNQLGLLFWVKEAFLSGIITVCGVLAQRSVSSSELRLTFL